MQRLLEDVMHIARDAGREIMAIYREGDFGVVEKEDNSPLTRADRASNALICARLEALLPAYPIVSEESKEIPFSDRRNFDRCWVVDPLDGTKEFIHRNDEFTVNIALIESGKPILGVVYVPALEEMFGAVAGEGAYSIIDGRSQRLQVADVDLRAEGLRVVCSRSHLNAETKAFVDRLNAPELVSRGSALKFMMIASGAAHLYPRLAPTMEWDVAAAQCIVEEAGGSVIEFSSKEPLHYNKESLLNPFFIASGKEVRGT